MTSTSKHVQDSAIESHIYKVFPNDLNAHRTVFGGLIMSTADRLALVVSERHSSNVCVTASVDSMHFMAPARDGDTLIFRAACNRSWSSSMEIGVRVDAENSYTQEKRHIVSAYFTFVALDKDNKPATIPSIDPQSELEKIRFDEAQIRRESRLRTRETLKQHREQRSI